jgi:hypothetical protein
MTADEMIDSYVADVVTLLPRKQRRDVAQELCALLTEEVDAAAGNREEVARELLTGFGRPAEVAARYGPPVTLIDPVDTRRFLTLAIAGAVLIPVGTALNALVEPAASRRETQEVVQGAILTVFAWLGLLVLGFGVAAWHRRRRPQIAWKPRPLPTDRINRLGRAAAIAFFVAGTAWLVAPQWPIRMAYGDRAAPAAYAAFTYDDEFLRLRGPIVLAIVIIGLTIQAVLLGYGRWRPWIRQADMVYSLAVCAALTWTVAAGPVFVGTSTDRSFKGAAVLIILISLIDVAVRTRRYHVRRAVQLHE